MKIACGFLLIFLLACNSESAKSQEKPRVELATLKLKAKESLQYCKSKNFNTDFCILIDMSLHSGVNRFFVWDFKKTKVIDSFLVGHGCCDNAWGKDDSKNSPKFSNIDNSHCSSLGKFKLGERAYSDWGVHVKYVMHGLEANNTNAQKRYIVFHSWDKVDDQETYPKGTPEGWGCPTISNNNFKKIDPKIKASKKPVLMWMYKE